MANKRALKKAVNNMVYDIVEECYSVQLYDPSKEEASNAVITETAAFHDAALNKINTAKNKAEFKTIVADIENGFDAIFDKVNEL